MAERVASCCCGQLRVLYAGEITRTSICHCLACQRRTGSAFGVQTRLDRDQARIDGRFTTYQRPTDEGDTVAMHFCPTCGSTVFWELDDLPGCLIVAAGAFADRTLPAPTFSVYEERMHPWVVVPKSVTERWP